jgi:hypothetical protein
MDEQKRPLFAPPGSRPPASRPVEPTPTSKMPGSSVGAFMSAVAFLAMLLGVPFAFFTLVDYDPHVAAFASALLLLSSLMLLGFSAVIQLLQIIVQNTQKS